MKNGPEYRGRELPWPNIVRFHKEIACRAEESFFSLNDEDQSERWSSLEQFEPEGLSGPWKVPVQAVRSHSFRLACEQGQHETVFIGGPCYVGSEYVNDKRYARWRPILYREVEVKIVGKRVEVTPRQAHWQLSPLIYGMLDRLQVKPDALETMADELIEKAARLQESGAVEDQSEALIRALGQMVPEVKEDIEREVRGNDFKTMPSPWVVFAPANRFSALTRYLINDYESLEKILEKNPEKIGGLKLLEDQQGPDEECEQNEPMPVVPLNAAQEMAVREALSSKSLTVISGPPGCGKSQVVVSLLLNCWASGTTVLFASNNNKAVDVVRERLERFESEFPIAVRAGAKKHNNVLEVLRRTLNMAAAANRKEKAADPKVFRQRRQELGKKRKALEKWLGSQQPQRIDETVRTALTAYSNHKTKLNQAAERQEGLIAALSGIGLKGVKPSEVERGRTEWAAWVSRLTEYRRLCEEDERKTRKTQAELAELKRQIAMQLAKVGVESDGAQAQWLLNGPQPELVRQWETKARTVFERPLDQLLQRFPWREEFDAWDGETEATRWGEAGNRLAEEIRGTCSAMAPAIERVRKVQEVREAAWRNAEALGIPERPGVRQEALIEWSAMWAEVCSLEERRWDFLPWSRRKKLGRQLRRVEGVLRQGLPVGIWTRIGTLGEEGRSSLAEVVESCRQWLEALAKWEEASAEREEIENRFEDLRAAAGKLRVRQVPAVPDTGEWEKAAALVEGRARIAMLAATAWKKRKAKEAAESLTRQLGAEWMAVAAGSPVKEAWKAGEGEPLEAAMAGLSQQQTLETMQEARKAFYATSLASLTEPWQAAREAQKEIVRLEAELETIPTVGVRVAAWTSERPRTAWLPAWGKIAWPDDGEVEEWRNKEAVVNEWCERWSTYEKQERPALLAEAKKELEWARQSIQQAAGLLPAVGEYEELRERVRQCVSGPEDWPTTEITEGFRAFSPEIIRAQIEGIDAELERGSFDDAKAKWLERLALDTKSVQAIDALEKALNKQRGAVQLDQLEWFKASLRLVPIWITTAQAPQAIPMVPELFDLVVIDEASQCTLTNLLPLMYRAKRLVVIGDAEQLPAIPTVRETEEEVIARKFEVEEYLQIIGHASNDVFKAATESLPRRRGDVHMLVEHFRSHPLVIGFSNRYIYGKRLVIKKDPKTSRKVAFGSGVHPVHVRGEVSRGERGRSWMNREEAKSVLSMLEKVRAEAPQLSIGVVTPFAAQKEYLREAVQSMGMASEVLVDTAYGFQGDERDVIIFSAVVGRGITTSACRWVESPPNLVNVALTRAREALFVVADFDYCMQQEGVLKKLAEYCKEVKVLRDTSPAELELFSWMIVEGLTPVVHPRIGDHEADFELKAESGIRVAIEVDGIEHHEGHEQRDKAIDAYLEGRGYRVVRVPARAVLETPHEVVHQIKEALVA